MYTTETVQALKSQTFLNILLQICKTAPKSRSLLPSLCGPQIGQHKSVDIFLLTAAS